MRHFVSTVSQRQECGLRRAAAIGCALVLAGTLVTTSAAAQTPDPPQLEAAGIVHDSMDIDESEAVTLFASAEAAVYFPSMRRARWLEITTPQTAAALSRAPGMLKSVRDFLDDLEADFPAFRLQSHGPYLLKLPAVSRPLASDGGTSARQSSAVAAAAGIVFTDSFESGLSQWKLGDNSGGKYDFAASACAARTGGWSADPVRAGTSGQTLACSAAYPKSVTTQLAHATCESIQGSSQSWLDFYFTADMDANDSIGVYYYLAGDGYLYGYTFTGSWSGWTHIVLNMKQWNGLGDLTAQPCPKVYLQFISGATNATHAGVRVDDVTIRTDAPPILRASVNATPASGTAPLTVTFSPAVTGSAGGETYQWSFGDAANSTSTASNASFTYTTPGTYWARLRVTDSTGTRSYAHTLITAAAPASCALTCTATAPAIAAAGSAVSFAATATATGCSSSPGYAWQFGDGQSSTLQSPTHSYSNASTFTWKLTATSGGVVCTKSGSIAVTPSTQVVRRRTVAPPSEPKLAISISGPTATVTQPGNLAGVAWTFPQAPPSGFSASAPPPSQIPAIPAGVTRLSDVFRVSPAVSGTNPITVKLPAALVPAGRLAKDLRLYVYSDAAFDVGATGSFGATSWLRTWYDLNVLPDGSATIKLTGVGGMAFIGIEAPVTAPAAHVVRTSWNGRLSAATSNCAPKALANGTTDANQQVCTIGYDKDKSFTATIKNIGNLHLVPGTSLGDVADWLAAGRKAFDGYGMKSDAAFEVEVGPMPPAMPNAFGFVTTRNLEDRRVLHITDAANAKNSIQGTAVHEYFHHAQSRTTEPGRTNLLDIGSAGHWLTEGLARWVEDDVFDSLNTYAAKERNPLPRLLEKGLAAVPDDSDSRTRAYARFAFWKLVQSHCTGFSIPRIMNVDRAADPNGLGTFKSRLESDLWQCDFGGGLGDGNTRRLATALLSYSFATIKNDDISLLDTNEPYFPFTSADTAPKTVPSPDCTPATACAGSSVTIILPPASAAPFVLESVSAPPEGKVATLWPDPVFLNDPGPGGGEVFLWAGKLETLMSGAARGVSEPALAGSPLSYGEDGDRAPRAIAFLMNGSTSNWVSVKVRAGFASPLKLDKFPWSHQTQWKDWLFPGVVWTSTGSGIVEAPKGTTVTSDVAVPATPVLKIRAHGATGAVNVTGTFDIKITPMSGRITSTDGSYKDFVFSNPTMTVDRLGTASGSSFRYAIPEADNQAGLLTVWHYDVKQSCFTKDGTPRTCVAEPTGGAAVMIIDFERKD